MAPFRASLFLLCLAILVATSGARGTVHADACLAADAQEASPHVSLLQTSLGMDEVSTQGFANDAAASTGVEAATEAVGPAVAEKGHDGDHRTIEILPNAESEVQSEPALGAALTNDQGVVVRLHEPDPAATALKASNEDEAKIRDTELADEVRHIATHRRATHRAASYSSDGLGIGVVVAVLVVGLFVLCMVLLFVSDAYDSGDTDGSLLAGSKQSPRISQKAGPPQDLPESYDGLPSGQFVPSTPQVPFAPSPAPRGGRSPTQTAVNPSLPYPSGGSLQGTAGAVGGSPAWMQRNPVAQTSGARASPVMAQPPPTAGWPMGADPAMGALAAAPMAVLPPICPSLILPRTEARFLLSMDSLLRTTSGNLEIKGTSGRPLLHATLDMTPQGQRRLTLASVGCEDDPRTIVVSTGAATSSPLEIYGRGSELYGTLVPAGGSSTLLYQGRPVMKIEYGPPADLCMSAFAMDGTALGTGQGGANGGGDQWKLQVKPGQDAVLIASCMLALILFCGRPGSR